MAQMEDIYQVLDTSSETLKKTLSASYLEALAESGENLFQNQVLQDVSQEEISVLSHTYEHIDLEDSSAENIRKGFQMAVLKGMKEATQPNHEMTPDAVVLFIGFLVNKFLEHRRDLSVLDPAVGTANLLTSIMNGNKNITESTAIDADDLLLKLSFVSANLQKHETEFFHQDAVRPLLIDPVDLVVSDLPVGYYPNDEFASSYQLKNQAGKSFIHHLLIEQSLQHTKKGGFLFFLIPNGLFQTEQTEQLNAFIKEQAVVQGLLQLPLSMFKKEQNAKSILVLQKKGPDVTPPEQALFADLPSFSDQKAMENVMQQISGWFSKNLSR